MPRAIIFPILAALAIPVSLALVAEADSAYRIRIAQWRQGREAALKADGGWLTVTGLFWLKEGANRVGSDPSSDVVLPAGAPANLGVVRVEKGAAVFTAATGSVTLNGKPVREAPLRYAGPVDVISNGPLDLLLLQRGDRLALRMKDKDSLLRRNFTHLSWFPVREDWRISAKFVPLPAHAKLVLDTVIGEPDAEESPGYVEFQRGGQTYRLQAVAEGDQLFFVMRDLTSGKSTYPASRFLYADPPKDGTVILDFNKAENPPCAFTPYATCPLPPPQNRLALAIEAGEMKYEGSAH
jgi:uncharacterized protein